MSRAKAAKGLITVGVLLEFAGSLVVVAGFQVAGLTIGGGAAVIVISGYLLLE